MKKTNLFIVLGIIIFLVLISGTAYYFLQQKQAIDQIDNFEKCKEAGYPILETYPEQCKTPNGKSFTKQYDSEPITVTGVVECLPHKDKDGAHTLECAYGIQESSTYKHYALSDPDFKKLSSVPTGTAVVVTGKFKSDNTSIYDIVGTITIETVDPVED